jgi:uncharacterized membrane protein
MQLLEDSNEPSPLFQSVEPQTHAVIHRGRLYVSIIKFLRDFDLIDPGSLQYFFYRRAYLVFSCCQLFDRCHFHSFLLSFMRQLPGAVEYFTFSLTNNDYYRKQYKFMTPLALVWVGVWHLQLCVKLALLR